MYPLHTFTSNIKLLWFCCLFPFGFERPKLKTKLFPVQAYWEGYIWNSFRCLFLSRSISFYEYLFQKILATQNVKHPGSMYNITTEADGLKKKRQIYFCFLFSSFQHFFNEVLQELYIYLFIYNIWQQPRKTQYWTSNKLKGCLNTPSKTKEGTCTNIYSYI